MDEPAKAEETITTSPDSSIEDGLITKPLPAATPLDDDAIAARTTRDGYRTTPNQEATGWPPGIPYIVGNEVCERFSYYGMKAILFVQLSALYVLAGQVEDTAKNLATTTTHLFNAGVYALPMIGAILADRLLGKYRTILWVSLIYCAGHGVLAFVDTVAEPQQKINVMYLGLALIAIGSGGIKPCVSANVGDQFGKGNWSKVRTVFQIFYFSVNFGSFFATLSIPLVKKHYDAGVAFAIPGILMFIATVIFWLGRKNFVHVPPKPGGKLGLLDTLSSVFLFMAVGHLFFTKDQPGWLIGVASAGFLAIGLALFFMRQRLAPDHGFLAITFHAIGQMFRPWQRLSPAASADDSWLVRSRFWGPAVERYGVEAVEGPVAVLKIISVFFLISVFWALFDQHGSSWIRQAAMMDLTLWGSVTVEATQVPSMNPLMVMALIPLMNLVYIWLDKAGIRTPPLARITVGMLVTALSFVAVAMIQAAIDPPRQQALTVAGASSVGFMGSPFGQGPLLTAATNITADTSAKTVWFAWQIIPYLLITIGEVLVAVTALEFSYTQAPKAMKSTIMSFFNLTVSLGNVLVAFLAGFQGLSLVNFFWVFAGLMAGAAVLFGIRAYFYVQKDYPQG